MRRLASALIVLLWTGGCDDSEPEGNAGLDAGANDAGRDAGRDAALDAARDASADGGARDATLRLDTACFSPLRPRDRSQPISGDMGCRCTGSDDEIYCMPGTFLLLCNGGRWTEGRDGPCWTGRDPTPRTCEQLGWSPRASSGFCPRGYGSVAPNIAPDGGIATPACCDDIEVSRDACLGGGFHVEAVTSSAPANLAWPCRDGSQVLGFIRDSAPLEGCCEGAP